MLHIVDLDHRGPHYEYQRVKMLTLDEVIAGLLEEEVVVERPDDEESKHQTGPGFEERRRFDAFKRIHMRDRILVVPKDWFRSIMTSISQTDSNWPGRLTRLFSSRRVELIIAHVLELLERRLTIG